MYEGIQFQDTEPTPLQKFAHRIFSICANSASCERLFSLFGATLTKLRSRLGLKNLINLAELRLHLRDEYMRMGDNKSRLRRPRKIIPDPPHPPSTTPSLEPPIDPALDDPSLSEQLDDEENDDHSLGSIASVLAQRSIDDDDTMEYGSVFDKVPLQQLFQFADESWVKLIEGFGMRSLEDELEFYELVDMDAEGDDDEQTFDDMMSSTI
jgi:hypothetical protein